MARCQASHVHMGGGHRSVCKRAATALPCQLTKWRSSSLIRRVLLYIASYRKEDQQYCWQVQIQDEDNKSWRSSTTHFQVWCHGTPDSTVPRKRRFNLPRPHHDKFDMVIQDVTHLIVQIVIPSLALRGIFGHGYLEKTKKQIQSDSRQRSFRLAICGFWRQRNLRQSTVYFVCFLIINSSTISTRIAK